MMTVITDRVPRHVCREACRISRARRDSWRLDGRGKDGRRRERHRLGPAVTKYPDPEGEIKARSFPRWGTDRRRKRKERGGREKPIFGNRYHRCRSQRPIPLNRLISLAAKIPIVASAHNWLLPRVIVLAPRASRKLARKTSRPTSLVSMLSLSLSFSANFSSADLSLLDALCFASLLFTLRVYSS